MLCSMCNCITQHQATLRITVIDLHRLSRILSDNIIVPHRIRSNSILSQTQHQSDLTRCTKPNSSSESTQNSSRTTHVMFHSAHSNTRFDCQSSSVIDDALTYQSDGRLFFVFLSQDILWWGIRHDYQPRWFRSTLSDIVDPPITLFFQFFTHNFFNCHCIILIKQIMTLLRKGCRGKFLWMSIHQSTRKTNSLRCFSCCIDLNFILDYSAFRIQKCHVNHSFLLLFFFPIVSILPSISLL
mmetsp:Transcript_3527/g.4561  ORF Transcript_3527/g.4561 Transcript_3527/m.4561 type:complete len:241 (+) Transcript_3527:584-1306(+)